MLYGALIGDIVGSRFEWNNYKKTDFELFNYKCRCTDDSIMTIAVHEACKNILKYDYNDSNAYDEFIRCMQKWGRKFPGVGYGSSFSAWLEEKNPEPYNSWGNGSAMRVSAVGCVFDNLLDVEKYAKMSAMVSHNHEEGIKGALAVAVPVYYCYRLGFSIDQKKKMIKNYIEKDLGYKLESLKKIRPKYKFDVSCQGTIPVAIECVLEGNSYEEVIRLAVSMGGDSDTIAAIAGSIAEPLFGIPYDIAEKSEKYMYPEVVRYLEENDIFAED